MADEENEVNNEDNTPPFMPFTALAEEMIVWLNEEGVAEQQGIQDLDTFIRQIRDQATYLEENVGDIDVSELTEYNVKFTVGELESKALSASNIDGGNMFVTAASDLINQSELDDGTKQDILWKNQYLNPYPRLKEIVAKTLQDRASDTQNPVSLDADAIDSFIQPTLLEIDAHITNLTKSSWVKNSSPIYASDEELNEVKDRIEYELREGMVLTPASCAEIAMFHLAENNKKAEERIQSLAKKSKRTTPTLQSQKQIDSQNAFYDDLKDALKARFTIEKINKDYGAEAGDELHKQIDAQVEVIKSEFDSKGIKPILEKSAIITALTNANRREWDPRDEKPAVLHLTPKRTVINAVETVIQTCPLEAAQMSKAVKFLNKDSKYSNQARQEDFDWAYIENPYNAVAATIESTYPENKTLLDRFEEEDGLEAFSQSVANHLGNIKAKFADNGTFSRNSNIPIRLERRRLEALITNEIITFNVVLPDDPMQGEPNAEATAHAIATKLVEVTHMKDKHRAKAAKVLAELNGQVSYGVDSPFASMKEALKAEYDESAYKGLGYGDDELKNLITLVDAQVNAIEHELNRAGIDVSISKKAIAEGLTGIQLHSESARTAAGFDEEKDQQTEYLFPRTSITHHVHSILKESAFEQTDKDKIANLMKDPILVRAKEQDASVLNQKDIVKRLKLELTPRLRTDVELTTRLEDTEKSQENFITIFETALDEIDKSFQSKTPPVLVPIKIDDVTDIIINFKVLPEMPTEEGEIEHNPDANVTAHALVAQIVNKAAMVEPHKGNANSELNAFESLIRSADYYDDPYYKIDEALISKFTPKRISSELGDEIFAQEPNKSFYDTMTAEIEFLRDKLTKLSKDGGLGIDLRVTRQQLEEAMKLNTGIRTLKSENPDALPDYLRPHQAAGQAMLDVLRKSGTLQSDLDKAAAYIKDTYNQRIKAEELKLIHLTDPIKSLSGGISEKFANNSLLLERFENMEGREIEAEELRDNFVQELSNTIVELTPNHPIHIRREILPKIVNSLSVYPHPGEGPPNAQQTANFAVKTIIEHCTQLSLQQKQRQEKTLLKHGVENGVNRPEINQLRERQENRFGFKKIESVAATVADYPRKKAQELKNYIEEKRRGPSLGPGVRSKGSTFVGNALVTLLGVGFVGVTAHESMSASSQEFEEQDRNWFQRNFRLDEWTFPKIVLGLSAILGGDYAIRGKHSLAAKAVNSVSGQSK